MTSGPNNPIKRDNLEGAAESEDKKEEVPELCFSCSYSEIHNVLSSIADIDDGGGFSPQKLSNIKRSAPTCKFCRLKLDALGLNSTPSDDDEHYTVQSPDQELSGRTAMRPPVDEELKKKLWSLRKRSKVHFFLGPAGQNSSSLDRVARRNASHNIQISDIDWDVCTEWDSLDPRDGYMFSGRSMGDIVDPGLLRTWLRMSAPAASPHSPPSIRTRFIDLETSSVIEGTTDRSFAVLSYVWGDAKQLCLVKGTKPALTAPGGLEALQADLPRTISDAIAVCKAVGERFLWVDALCIQQDDPQDKRSQIAAMGSIYGVASFTIVQASSNSATDANHPLPGLLPGSRIIRQRSEIIQGRRIQLTHRPPLFAALQRSRWLTRAWTLQEQYLSRRLLYFTDCQVFLTSDDNHIFCEDTVFEHNQPGKMLGCCISLPSQSEYDWDFNPFDKRMFSTQAERLFFLITDYTARQVRQEDAFNAITALLKRFEPKLGDSMWGAPSRVFDYTVCWSAVGSAMQRRSDFPSWSWLGWEAPVRFLDNLDPFQCRTSITLAGRPKIRAFDSACMIDWQADDFLSLRREHGGTQVGPSAATPSEIGEYYRSLLGHERTDNTGGDTAGSDVGGDDGRLLYFTTTAKTLRVDSVECEPPHSIRAEKPRSDAWFRVTCPESPGFITQKLSAIRSWRESQPRDLDIEFLAVGIRKATRKRNPGAEEKRDLVLLPVRWVMESVCKGSEIRHPVAKRIGEISVLQPSDETFGTWMALAPKPVEKFIILG
ncbi:hypothetical protein DL770_005636 [Monosporascus sp. CRB-9-2]|nr:hypothetical protein DL770_005636 [Monosporascus sp. CRB-9-2]